MRRWLGWLLVLPLMSTVAAERVVSLAPSLTEIVVELGAQDALVGVQDGGERPAAVANLPSVGRYGQLDIERLLSLQPDLLLVWPGSISPAQREQLQRLGLAQWSGEPHTLAQLADQIELLGERLGRAQRGKQLAGDIRQRLSALQGWYGQGTPLRVFYQVWDAPLYTVGGKQIISDALRACGARNVFENLDLPAPQVSVESVIAQDPQVIVVGSDDQRAAWGRWPQLTAVRRHRVITVPDKGLERPSGQMIGAVERLCATLHDD